MKLYQERSPKMAITVRPGRPLPFGAHIKDGVASFSLFSRHGTRVWLLLFDRPEDKKPSHTISLTSRTGDIWHCEILGLSVGQLYAYRVDGAYSPDAGKRFNRHRLLLDPYAKAITDGTKLKMANAQGYDPDSAESDLSFSIDDNAGFMPKCVLICHDFDWQGDQPLNYPLKDCIIYETHVRGLTQHDSAKVKDRGSFRGVLEKLDYFKTLGITSLELLPVMEFDENENLREDPQTGVKLKNFWGYSTISFFAPNADYSTSGVMGQQVSEFKKMVRELHKAGIEVILDIVLNHTAEGNELGPTLSFRGLDNVIYYMLEQDPRYYKNYSGCGNTLNCNHPIVREFVLGCLRYWVIDMHVDGFRFDLASILGRGPDGALLENPPLVEKIAEDPILRNTKIIAEAWDAAGAYQVGSFPGRRWAEWNGRYRDDLRRFWRGDSGMMATFATRFAGSSDLYQEGGRSPFHSINFITCHDGFTLNDLVSYNEKHNEANGEYNMDGTNENYSFNFGVEGPTEDPEVEAFRLRQIKNYLTSLLLSQGTPMLLGGDEFRRTQQGNNNAYCQDNEISWYDWTLKDKNAPLLEFCQKLIQLRKMHPVFRRPHFFKGKDHDRDEFLDIHWFDADGNEQQWQPDARTLICLLDGGSLETGAAYDDNDFCILVNSSFEDQNFQIPPVPTQKKWKLSLNTANEAPNDLMAAGRETELPDQQTIQLKQRSMVVLLSDWNF